MNSSRKERLRNRRWFRWTVTVLTVAVLALWTTSLWYRMALQAGWVKWQHIFSTGEKVFLVHAMGVEAQWGVLTLYKHEKIRSPVRANFVVERPRWRPILFEWLGLRIIPDIDTNGHLFVRFPLWPIAAALLSLTAWCWWPLRKKAVPDRCSKCDYSLIGNVSGRCPECGTDVPIAAARSPAVH